MAFSRKKCNLPVEDINGKIQGVEQKSLEFPGGAPKIEEKRFQGGQCKKMENSRGVHGKFDWNF